MKTIISKTRYFYGKLNKEFEMIIRFEEINSQFFINIEMDSNLFEHFQINIENRYLKILPAISTENLDPKAILQLPVEEKQIKIPDNANEFGVEKTQCQNNILFKFPKKIFQNEHEMYY